MNKTTIKAIAEKMKDVDFCMMTTQDGRGTLHSRPMSNNREVEYDGNSWFFTYEDTGKVKQITGDPKTTLSYQTDDMLFISCYGHAKIVKDKSTMEKMWLPELRQWFPQGIDTPDMCMVKVEAHHIRYWHKAEEGEWKL